MKECDVSVLLWVCCVYIFVVMQIGQRKRELIKKPHTRGMTRCPNANVHVFGLEVQRDCWHSLGRPWIWVSGLSSTLSSCCVPASSGNTARKGSRNVCFKTS